MSEGHKRIPGWQEYLVELKSSGIWDNTELRVAAQEEWRRLAEEQHARDEAPIVADLQAAGLDVKSVWDLVSRKESFSLAMPVLRKHLSFGYPPKVREGIARAMSDSAARPYWFDLVRLYREESDKYVKDALAVALCGAAGPEHYDALINLMLDPANGSSRILLMWALERRFSVEQAEPVLQQLAKDPVTKMQAEADLKVLKAKMARKKKPGMF